MNNNNDKNFFIERPFGPAVAEFKVEKNLIDQVNSYTENIIQNNSKLFKIVPYKNTCFPFMHLKENPI